MTFSRLENFLDLLLDKQIKVDDKYNMIQLQDTAMDHGICLTQVDGAYYQLSILMLHVCYVATEFLGSKVQYRLC